MTKEFRWSDKDARAALSKYERMVNVMARRLRVVAKGGRGLDEDDLKAEGHVAVLEALSTYHRYGITERTWVRTRIKQRMIDAIRKMDIRSRNETRLAMRVSDGTVGDEERDQGRLVGARRLVSVDAAARDGYPLLGKIADQSPQVDEVAHARFQRRRLETAMHTLPNRQRQALQLGLFEGKSLREIGGVMGISESRVCQLQKRAVFHLNRSVGQAEAPRATA